MRRTFVRSSTLAVPLLVSLLLPTTAWATDTGPTTTLVQEEADVWSDYLTSETTSTTEAAAFAADDLLYTATTTTPDPGVMVPLGNETTGEAATGGLVAVNNARAEDGGGEPDHPVWRYGPTVRPGGRRIIDFASWQIGQQDELLTVRTKVCNYPSTGHGSATWYLVRNYDGATKKFFHTCANYQQQNEPVWYDSFLVGNGHFVTFGRSYHLRLYWEPACSGENSPVSDGRYPPRLAGAETASTSSGDVECDEIRVYANLSAH